MFAVSKRPTISEIHQLYAGGAMPSQIVTYFINRSKEKDKNIQAVLRYTPDHTAKEVEWAENILKEYQAEWEDEWLQKLLKDYPLFGIPYNLKDNILVSGLVTTSASKIMESHISSYDATVFERLRDNGAILISQSNLDEWAVGSSTENSAMQVTKNPFDTSRVPGGSSGGPAAAVGSGQVVFSLGSDTGGSIRVPAAFTDTVGIKTTYGLVPRYGVMPLSSSLDQVGVFSNNIEDNILVTSIIAGQTEMDQTTIESHELVTSLHTLYLQQKEKRKQNGISSTSQPLVIGLPKEYFADGLEPQIRTAIETIIEKLKGIGHTFKEVSLPLTSHGLAVYYTTMTVETASNLQRFEGLRFGNNGGDFFETREKYMGDEPKRRIMLGTFASSSGYYDAYYNTAMKVREQMKRDFENVFSEVDILIAPTTAEFPFKIGEKTSDPIKMYLSDALVYGANLARIPAMSIPLGLFEYEGSMLPTGIQIIAPEKGDNEMYALSLEIEKLTKS